MLAAGGAAAFPAEVPAVPGRDTEKAYAAFFLGQGGYLLYSAMPTVEYLEANGYDVAYAVDHDVHADSALLPRARLVIGSTRGP